MATNYSKCGKEVQKQCQDLMAAHHPHLAACEVKVVCMFAKADEERPAVKLHGRPCYATVRKVGPKERALGMPDAVIMIDRRLWNALEESQRDALIDHELTHLAVKRDDDDAYVLEEDGRPKLEMVPHDWELHGFADVVARHGASAIELQDIGAFRGSDCGQLVFGFIDALIEKKKTAA